MDFNIVKNIMKCRKTLEVTRYIDQTKNKQFCNLIKNV